MATQSTCAQKVLKHLALSGYENPPPELIAFIESACKLGIPAEIFQVQLLSNLILIGLLRKLKDKYGVLPPSILDEIIRGYRDGTLTSLDKMESKILELQPENTPPTSTSRSRLKR